MTKSSGMVHEGNNTVGLSRDTLWVLREAAKPGGFSPNAESVRDFIMGLEVRGLVRQSNNYPCWYITDRGRLAIAKAEGRS